MHADHSYTMKTIEAQEPERSLSELIAYIERLPSIPFAGRLAARIRYLAEISREEYPDQAPPVVPSLMGLITLLERTPGLAYPDVVLTPQGNIRAQWRRDRNRHFALEFLGGDDARFVVFASDPRHPYKTLRASGLATVDSVLELVRPYGVLDWVLTASNEAT
jgi:hypothetical protein